MSKSQQTFGKRDREKKKRRKKEEKKYKAEQRKLEQAENTSKGPQIDWSQAPENRTLSKADHTRRSQIQGESEEE
ncbi:hypothetical protein KFE98_06185 [bacterium SCSIO 12741]|nr:hypothetical protein KFE98_06185 [bacterium SCSIO 12741]